MPLARVGDELVRTAKPVERDMELDRLDHRHIVVGLAMRDQDRHAEARDLRQRRDRFELEAARPELRRELEELRDLLRSSKT